MAEINTNASAGNQALADVLESILTDLTTLQSALNTLGVKLNSDGGVSDTDYATGAALVTTT